MHCTALGTANNRVVTSVTSNLRIKSFFINGQTCRGRDSNPHEGKPHGFLRPTRLPIPPPRQTKLEFDCTISPSHIATHCALSILTLRCARQDISPDIGCRNTGIPGENLHLKICCVILEDYGVGTKPD